jgi:hypothetical protein
MKFRTRAPGRARRATFLSLVAGPLLGGVLLLAIAPAASARDGAPPSNSQLLLQVVRAVARRLVAEAPITPGTRVALRAESDQPVDTDAAEALLFALNERRIECVLIPPVFVGAAAAPAPAETPAKAPAPGTDVGGLKDIANQLDKTAKADSAAAAHGTEPGRSSRAASSLLFNEALADLPVLSYRVAEARVDYVRVFRGGLFGAERIERRATARLSLKLSGPGSDAVRWSAAADSSIGDVVMRGESSALEDRQRPETRPIAPSSGLKKIVEPALVVVLIAGLVSLFYQNRP